MAAPAHDRLVWLDLEMTGLDVERHVIVEIACFVTDAELEPLDAGIDVVVHADDAALAEMNEYVTKMHKTSGLLSQIRASELDIDAAGDQVLTYVKHHVPEASAAPLCGNSIGMDRRFVARYLPALDAHLHYRNIDVSSIKELCRRWYPEVYRLRPAKAESHRALDDIRESLAELAYYRAKLFAPRADATATGG